MKRVHREHLNQVTHIKPIVLGNHPHRAKYAFPT